MLTFLLNLLIRVWRDPASMPIPMHAVVKSQIARLVRYERQLINLLLGTGRSRFATFRVTHTNIMPVARVQPHGARAPWKIRPLDLMAVMLVMLCGLFWCNDFSSHSRLGPLDQKELAVDLDTVAEQIIKIESNGDPHARNKRSSATGLGQFVNETWLILIRTHRPDLAKGRSESDILEMRRDAAVAREITLRFTERNAWILKKRGLPVTPGALYLAHFAGSAGAVALLSAEGQADAASVMASADGTRRTDRETLVRLNPFLERLTVAGLKVWADRKMRVSRS
jgi:hypothetical protein